MVDDAALQYLSERHCSTQWRDFLEALSAELSEQLGEEGMLALMTSVGGRFAAQFSPGSCVTLEELERAIAQIWLDIDWGWTSIHDAGEALLIRHYCAPLSSAQNGTVHWAAVFLQGAYQHWFQSLGSSDTLKVKALSRFDATGSIDFRFGR
ncbi:cellulose biosynthesis protein BcsD [Cupriavidus sp. WKF15]|uniref:cellulose biosynthesis protein BcsD n=1 Tax=Cupriavidus sp. WKF15 TaxID=3032282 RepID=UPI0023E32192|nr:cellulose biosynthesis protein BcsD [Cupriavidus sp. WKF15]WER47321.1 cellulose biosynthesis protein BcsD [Cupriavidus sp. WKF15]